MYQIMSFKPVIVRIKSEDADQSIETQKEERCTEFKEEIYDIREEVLDLKIKEEILDPAFQDDVAECEIKKTEVDSEASNQTLNDGSDVTEEEQYNILPISVVRVELGNKNDVPVENENATYVEAQGKHPCHICGAQFHLLSHVMKHLKEKCANQYAKKTLPCSDCSLVFVLESDLAAHRLLHNGPLHACDICNEKFLTQELLSKHCAEHESESKGYSCTICHKKLKAKYSLKIHMTAKHLSVKPFSCEECGMKFPAQWRLREHMKLHTGDGLPCMYCDKQFVSKTRLDTHLRTHTGDKPFECTVCGKKFTSMYGVKIHMRIHTGEKNFVCEVCTKAFYTKSDLTAHTIAVHSTDRPKPFPCTDCEWTFAKKTQLRKHFINCHTSETPYSCETCQLKFKSKPKWKYHMMQHSDGKPFKCSVCGKEMLLKYQLLAHMRQHSDARPHKCQFCEKAFKSRSNLNTHVGYMHKDVKAKSSKKTNGVSHSTPDTPLFTLHPLSDA